MNIKLKKQTSSKSPFLLLLLFLLFSILPSGIYSQTIIAADDPNIQYFGRWDFADPLAPTHSWPGVYIYVEFEGTSIGVKMNDNFDYYNVIIDDTILTVFHGTNSGISSYTLASGLPEGQHSILFVKRSETNWTKFSFNGFILDNGKTLLPPKEKPVRKIEFIGDSFTCASGNEWTDNSAPSNVEKYTNIYEGFGSITARHFNAQYVLSGRSGYGLVLDYTGNYEGNLPDVFDRTVLIAENPKWDFEGWVPNLVVICLGLNDYSGFGGYSSTVAQDKTDLYKTRYHEFIAQIRDVYPGVKILTVAAHVEWIQNTVQKVVQEENESGNKDVFYTYFPYYNGGYVNNGHPNVETHHKIAERLIAAIDTINAWEPYVDNVPPEIVKLPVSPFTVYDTTYTLEVTTDSYSTLRYSTADKPFDEMENDFTVTGKREHSVKISCEHNQQYTIYIRAEDLNGNAMSSSAVVQFDVDTTKILLSWQAPCYDASSWKSGPTPMGTVGKTGIKTELASVTTAYFRKKFEIQNYETLIGFGLMIKGNDGAVVYLNGHEVERINMFTDEEVLYNTLAIEPQNMTKMVVINSAKGLDKLHNGENVVTVEIHSSNSAAPGLLFDSQLFDNTNKIYYKLGSDWSYYDAGNTPEDQLTNKTTDVATPSVPVETTLHANYPNPFNPETNISFSLKEKSKVELKVYDMLGKEVCALTDKELNPGRHSYKFDAGNLSSGIYFYRLKTGSFISSRKMILIK